MISTLKEIDSGNRWSLWLLKKMSCILLLKKTVSEKSEKNVTSSHIEMFVDPPEKTYGKTTHETTSLSCDDPKPIGFSHRISPPSTPVWCGRCETPSNCSYLPPDDRGFGQAASRRNFPRGKKMAGETKGKPIWWNLKMIGFQNRQKKHTMYIQQGVVFLKLKGVEESGTPFPIWHPFFQGPGRGMFIRRSKKRP